MVDLARTRLIYVAPAAGRSGVGDYADDFLAEVAPHFLDVVDYRIETEGAETVREVVAHARRVRELVVSTAKLGPTLVHVEQSGGSLSVFWASLLRGVNVTATVHDPPFPVWWPFKTKFVGRHRLLHHAVHYPFRAVTTVLQRRVLRGRTVFALTTMGADSIREKFPQSTPIAARIFVPARPDLTPPAERPLAVGLFGHVYRGKGFDLIGRLREELDADIDIRAAGRGTADLPPVDGVTLVGEVNGPDEDRFFESIRLLLVPYSKHNPYGKAYPASSAVTRSFAYGTPIVCITEGALAETVSRGGAVGVDGVDDLAAAVLDVVRDTASLDRLGREVTEIRRADAMNRCAAVFLDAWAALADVDTPEYSTR
ncbi:hypothetical protein ASG56_07070 [Rhodococcus sp. Leaf7]|uniref:glycosyltransferase family 1 protein n=1 Tax=unclassified Rhodococcus (in: high G+C Gram-positive bacteria) TaxID=192944 RepID=UPI0006F2FA93|nr:MULTISPECIES: glycosyltransferase family 1 protein [unclassified Rhodococcus (in: high G+C Gram-positive bacteria)]KQU07281.1 hypothetical protein ASG56_07070 [Rhodococcus sp. Leaf7]KQU42799.1 hypothetical protein ASG64_07070 [Rhodococcus sp. Leaf247]